MARLTPFLFTQNLSVDNALSTIQVIHQLITKMNGVVDYVNNIENISNEYADNELNKLNVELRAVINSVKNELNDSLNNLDNKLKTEININSDNIELINDKIKALNVDFDSLANEVENNNALTISNYNTLIASMSQLKNYVDELITAMTVKVYSVVDGTKKDIQQALNDIYRLYSLNIGNVTYKYVKKLLENSVELIVDGAPYPPINTVTFSTVTKAIELNRVNYMIDFITTYNDTSYNYFYVYNKIKSARQYSLYALISLLGLYYESNHSIQLLKSTKAITTNMYNLLGYAYTQFLPVSFGWYGE